LKGKLSVASSQLADSAFKDSERDGSGSAKTFTTA